MLRSGNWLGFAMMRAPGATLHTFGAPVAFQNAYPTWNRLQMVKVALNLAEGLRFLNANGVLMVGLFGFYVIRYFLATPRGRAKGSVR